MKNLQILFLVATTLFPSIILSKPSTENNKAAIAALQQCVTLLNEEDTRWKTIHSNPVTDVWTVKRDGDDIIVNVTIDSGVKNIINDQPITRKYTLVPETYNLFAPYDLMCAGTLMTNIGWRPNFGIGYSPKWAYGFGAGISTTLMSLNLNIYYTNKLIPHAFMEILAGLTFLGKPTYGLGAGVRF